MVLAAAELAHRPEAAEALKSQVMVGVVAQAQMTCHLVEPGPLVARLVSQQAALLSSHAGAQVLGRLPHSRVVGPLG